ncbi:MAG TPA: ABC-2 transporter permease [Candidatus Merdicola faecigallinarum]|uniref:ABC-2 transporter permease n=1 Tax=Candidatus Merdicola faecigallinarum TaxID=2840862 RepID=A0A9D1M1U0_9FIRM|nr:ABC-2 transporter permease [Candidatus Merdicola faecigallinarum]
MIKGLLKKDLYNLSSYKASLIVIILFCGIAIIGTESINLAPIIIGVIVGMISLSTFSYDEISKSNRYILTLPTNRKEIVAEKYILAIGATIIGGIIGFILTVIVVNIMNNVRPENIINLDYESLITSVIGGIWGISLLQAIQIPSIFKWGAEKGRIQMFILVFIIIAAVGGIYFLVTKANININMEMINLFINKFGLIILVATMIIMYFISYKIAYKVYKNKEE